MASSTITVPTPTRPPEDEDRLSPRRRLLTRVAAHPLAVGVVFSVVLALVASRGFLFRPGWIAYSADFSIHSSRRMELENWLTGWNHFVGDDNSPILSVAPVWLLLLSFVGTAAAQKIFLATILFTASASSFYVGEHWARAGRGPSPRTLLVGSLCGLCYTVNPWVATEIVHFYYVWLYALLPVTVYLMARAVAAESVREAAGNVLLAGVVAVATLTAYGVLFHLIVAGLFLAVDVIGARRGRVRRLKRSALLLLILIGTVATVGTYSTVPVLFGFASSFVGGTSWALFTTEAMFILSPFTPFLFAIRGMFRFTTAELLDQSIPRASLFIASTVSALPALLVGVRLILRRLQRADIALLALLGLSLLIANGTNWPAGDHYATLAQGPLSAIAFVLFKGPYKLVALVTAALVLLSIRAVIALLATDRMRGLAVTAGIGMAVWSVVLGSPLLTGDLASYLRPVEPPPGYLDALRSIPAGDEEGGRAVWLPTDTTGGQQPAWTPARRTLPLIGGAVSPPAAWLSPTPISSRGTSYSPPAAGRIFDQLFTYALMSRPDVDVAELLHQSGRAHVVLQRDVTPEASKAAADDLGELLRSRPELSLVAETPELAVFTAAHPPADGSGHRLAVGGHEQLLLAASAGRAPHRSVVLADDLPRGPVTEQLLAGAGGLTFAPGQGWEDLVLNSWPDPEHLHPLADHIATTKPLSPWRKTFFESNDWIGVTAYTGAFDGQRFGPGLSGPFLFTTESAAVSFRAETAGTVDVWVRAFVNPGAGTLTVSVGGTTSRSVPLSADPALGWKWFRVGEHMDLGGNDRISIRVVPPAAATGSVTAVDQVAVLPAGALAARVDDVKAATAGVAVGLGGGWGSFVAPPGDQRGEADPTAARLVQVPRTGTYRVGVSGLGGAEPFALATLGGAPLSPAAADGAWRYSGPVELRAEAYVLGLPGLDPRAFVTVEEVTARDRATVRSGTAPLQDDDPTQLQVFREPFNGGWRVDGVDPDAHLRVNGFVNGFVVREPGKVHFGPDAWVRGARLFSLVAVTSALVAGVALAGGRVGSRATGAAAGRPDRRRHAVRRR